MGEAGVVDEDVEPAELLLGDAHRFDHRVRLGDVEPARHGVAPELRGDTAGRVEVEIGDDDAGALGRELAGDRRPECTGTTGDDGDPAVEPVRMDHDVASWGARRRRSTHTIKCDSRGDGSTSSGSSSHW